MQPTFERLGRELPKDAAYVLLRAGRNRVLPWARQHGIDSGVVIDAVYEALERLPLNDIRPFYDSYRFSGGGRRSVTWFRRIPEPSLQTLEGIPEAPVDASELGGDFGLVWAERISDHSAARLAFPTGRSTVVTGLAFRQVEHYGLGTILWRKELDNEPPILEVHADYQIVPRIIESLLPSVGVDVTAAEVLDIRDKTAVAALQNALGGTLHRAKFKPDEETSAADFGTWQSYPGRSLDEPDSPFVTAGHNELRSLSRTLDCNIDGERVTITVSSAVFSVQLAPMSLPRSGSVLRGAASVGTWISFQNRGDAPAYGLYRGPRRSP